MCQVVRETKTAMSQVIDTPTEAVIFDLGGVILHSPFAAIAEYETRLGVGQNTVNAVIGASGSGGAFARLERGELTIESFSDAFAADCKVAGAPSIIDGGELIRVILDSCTPRPLMTEALGILRESRVRTCALTNNFRSATGDDRLASSIRELQPLFDEIVQSAEEGLRKPDPAIYELAISRLGVPASACIFVDDIGRNLKPAQALGMRTIKCDVSDASGARALKALSTLVGGQAGPALQRWLRRARL